MDVPVWFWLVFGLVVITVRVKMLTMDLVKIPTLVSLGVIAAILVVSIVASLARPPAAPLPAVDRR